MKDEVLEALAQIAHHPAGFAFGVGIANGILAESRSLPFTLKSAALYAAVVGIGEAVIAADNPNHKYSVAQTALLSVVGIAAGLAPFVAFGADKSLVQAALGRPALEHA